MDTNNSGEIEYSEFITACMDVSVQLSRQNLELTFDALANENGLISREQMRVFFEDAGAQDEQGDSMLEQDIWQQMKEEFEMNEDGEIEKVKFI